MTVETVEEQYVPHIQPPQEPLSYIEVGSGTVTTVILIISCQFVWYSFLNYFSNPWAILILLYLLYR